MVDEIIVPAAIDRLFKNTRPLSRPSLNLRFSKRSLKRAEN